MKTTYLHNAQAVAGIRALIDNELISRGRLCPVMIEKAQQVRALLIDHVQSNPVENLEIGVQLIGGTQPLNELVQEVRKHFPKLNLTHILKN